MKKKLILLSMLLVCFMGGCGEKEIPDESSDTEYQEEESRTSHSEAAENEGIEGREAEGQKTENQKSDRPEGTDENQNEDSEEKMLEIIQDVYTNKARYDVGETVEAYVELLPVSQAGLTLEISVRHLAEEVYFSTLEVPAGGEETLHTIQISMPEEDFTGYSLEVYAKLDGQLADYAMSAVEVASDWSRFPRYAYLTRYGSQTDEQIRETLLRLNKHHITGLFYYDVLSRHEKPAAGSVDEPPAGWHTLANSYASYETVSKLISFGHEYNMNSYLYNLIFGAYADYEQSGVKAEWGVYRDPRHEEQDYHGDFPDGWATKRLYLFNPANTEWQDYYLDVTREALAVFGYDGLQVDSLGSRGVLYDYDGAAVDLKTTYPVLLNRLTDEIGCKVIFNPVSGYGMREILTDTDYDIIYEEIWPGDAPSYGSMKAEVDHLRSLVKAEKGIVIAAYMNYKKQGGVFNTPGVLLTDAVLMSSGAAHLEIGDTGMLKSEYYPGDTLRIKEDLEKALRNYYSFSVAYENYLRDASWKEVLLRTYINGKTAALDARADAIWSFTKVNDRGEQVIHFINLKGLESLEWVDDNGEQKEPERQKNLTVLQHVDIVPEHIYLASPDQREGILSELEFESGEDSEGTYVQFTMPELAYWNMVIVK
ncbi:MAG: glycoside hydrolase family 66 protein [Acetatifactor sp.]|nr:glycoside hydrolase family 66 protein [Acetatifactor sp.]